ncbi:MAG: UrcA family protein [Steroidobacteraceae bacterium]
MTIPAKPLDLSQSDSGIGKLALIGLCIVFMTGAIGKQLPAQAADAVAMVSIADLDLSTDQGMQTARERVNETARRLCKKVVDPWALSHHSQYVRCVDDATTAALEQIHGQALVASARP